MALRSPLKTVCFSDSKLQGRQIKTQGCICRLLMDFFLFGPSQQLKRSSLRARRGGTRGVNKAVYLQQRGETCPRLPPGPQDKQHPLECVCSNTDYGTCCSGLPCSIVAIKAACSSRVVVSKCYVSKSVCAH